MARYSSFPTLYDNATFLSITKLKKWGYLHRMSSGTITWSIRGEKVASVGIHVVEPTKEIMLMYTYREQDIKYRIFLVSVPSNLQKGEVLYFLCPVTGLRCRTLYLHNGRFVHRNAKPGFYQSQVYGHRDRHLCRLFDEYFAYEKAYEIITRKHFKKYYRGKSTKSYRKIQRFIEQESNYPQGYVESLLVGNVK